jgi:hypothetical protein
MQYALDFPSYRPRNRHNPFDGMKLKKERGRALLLHNIVRLIDIVCRI